MSRGSSRPLSAPHQQRYSSQYLQNRNSFPSAPPSYHTYNVPMQPPSANRRDPSYGETVAPSDSISNYDADLSNSAELYRRSLPAIPRSLQPGLSHIAEDNDGNSLDQHGAGGSQQFPISAHYDPWEQQGANGGLSIRDGDRQSLIASAAGFAGYDEEAAKDSDPKGFRSSYPPSTLEPLGDQPKDPQGVASRLLGSSGKYPLEQRIENKKRGIDKQKYPFVCWILTAVMTGVMIWELVSNYKAQGTVISLKPVVNYMLGPSAEVLINDGARFVPCMKQVAELPPSFLLACLNDTANPATSACTLGSICGFGGISENQTPNQSFRFVLPIFLHVGIIHLLLNMVAQLTAGAQIEREIGSFAFIIIYFAGGIFGFILGGNFSRTGIPSVGASGSLFAVNSVYVIDLCLHWKYTERPKLKALYLTVEFLIGVAIGYIPYAVDGMAHLGGYSMGLLLGIIFYPAISETKRKVAIIWILRVIAIAVVIVAFVLSIKNFYTADPNAACEWCKYLSCIPTAANDRCTGTGLTTTSSTTRRSWEL